MGDVGHQYLPAAQKLVAALGGDLPATDTNVRQAAVLMEAFDKFQERNAKRHDLWKVFGWKDSALHMRSKAARIALALEGDLDVDPEELLDDAIDIINYAVFYVRNVRGV
jgi:hypothetical protein